MQLPLLLPHIEKFIRARNIAPTRFGRDAVRDPRFVLDLRNGREPRAETVRRVLSHIDHENGEGR